MKKQLITLILVVSMAMLAVVESSAQELMYDHREVQLSYDGSPSPAAVIFNGKQFAAFYYWAGNEDVGAGLYFRRIDNNALPLGPQKKLLSAEINESGVTAVWDGSAYIVFVSSLVTPTWKVVRVDTKGKTLASRTVLINTNKQLRHEFYPYVVGDQMYLFFTIYNGFSEGTPYLLTADRELKSNPTLTTLPTAGMQYARINGVALDPEKFLVALAQYKVQIHRPEIQKAVLLHIGFDGKVKKTIKPAAAEPAKKASTVDLLESAGPLYTGDGYIMIGARQNPVPGESYPFLNTSLKINDVGEIISGPFSLGGGKPSNFLGKAVLLGQHVGLLATDFYSRTMQAMLLGSKGGHITNIPLYEDDNEVAIPETADAAYYGAGTMVTYHTRKNPHMYDSPRANYSNIISEPSSITPGVVYFQASSGEAFGDTRRLILWSVSSGTNVSLVRPGLKLKNLPPVSHTVIDTNGKKTRLKLKFVGTDGKKRKSKIVIKP